MKQLSMKRVSHFIIGGLLLCSNLTFSQSSREGDSSIEKTKKFYIGLGGSFGTFQDVKYSNVSYNGAGKSFEIGYTKMNNKRFIEINLGVLFSTEHARTYTEGTTKILNPTLNIKYLKMINENLYFRRTLRSC